MRRLLIGIGIAALYLVGAGSAWASFSGRERTDRISRPRWHPYDSAERGRREEHRPRWLQQHAVLVARWRANCICPNHEFRPGDRRQPGNLLDGGKRKRRAPPYPQPATGLQSELCAEWILDRLRTGRPRGPRGDDHASQRIERSEAGKGGRLPVVASTAAGSPTSSAGRRSTDRASGPCTRTAPTSTASSFFGASGGGFDDFSPDGKRFLFTRCGYSDCHWLVARTDGSHVHPAPCDHVSGYSPDGRSFLGENENAGGNFDLVQVSLASCSERLVVRNAPSIGVWQPLPTP